MIEQQISNKMPTASTILKPLSARNIAPRTITLSQPTLTQIHGMLISSVLRVRDQLSKATSPGERELYEADQADCIAALEEFNQAVRC